MAEAKNEIIGRIREYNEAKSLFIVLMDVMIIETREKYDSSTSETFSEVKGRVNQLKELRDIFSKPVVKDIRKF